MSRYLLRCLFAAILLWLACPALVLAGNNRHDELYKEFLRLYRTGEDDQAFYQTAEELANLYKQQDQLSKYYTMQLNICLYDTEHNHPYKALKRANEMLEEMKVGHNDNYENVYAALGTVYESRGNYRMASHYYQEALSHTKADDQSSQMSVQSRLAFLYMFTNPEEARRWNATYRETSLDFPDYHQVYLFIEGVISFSMADKKAFDRAYETYASYASEHKLNDNYGQESMQILRKLFDRKFDEVEQLLKEENHDLDDIGQLDMAIRAYDYMGQKDKALQLTWQRADLVDSLNSDMLFNNLNELNAQAGLNRANLEAGQARENTFNAILVFSLVIIAILVVWLFMYKKTKQNLKEKNEQLRAALAMAEEGEKMKTEFVRSVSHEIRTPLNAINGFNDLLNSPDIELTQEERADMLNRVKENVQAITNIVDDMLHTADKESNEFYPKMNHIYCNQFLSALLYEHRNHVSPQIELNYTTHVINRFQLETNEEGLRKVLEHLIQNAIKFTQRGSIVVHCELSDDKRQLLISVTDTGCGISKEQQPKIFDGFYKADSFQQGIGLGLTVSKKIAKKLGGDLTFDPSYTGGARFVLSLPAE